MNKRPQMNLAGMDGNIFAILGRASQLLKRNGLSDQAKEMSNRVFESDSYPAALQIISEYVETEISLPMINKSSSKKKTNRSKDHSR